MSAGTLLLSILFLLPFTGCQSVPKSGPESDQETLQAVGSATEALTGKQLTEEEKRQLLRDLQKDEDAQSAMKSISGALDVKQTGIKYCPVDGRRFSADVIDCPDHKVQLKELTD
jgi:hypothetical protein